MAPSSSRLIFVSNRLPVQLTERAGKISIKTSDGGLVSAAKSYFEKIQHHVDFTEMIWVGAADFSEDRWNRYKDGKHKENSFTIDSLTYKVP